MGLVVLCWGKWFDWNALKARGSEVLREFFERGVGREVIYMLAREEFFGAKDCWEKDAG